MFDYEGWVADDGAEEFLFGDLFEVGEAEFREEFLGSSVSCSELNRRQWRVYTL